MTDYSELLSAGRIRPGRFGTQQVQSSLRIARRDLKTATSVMELSPEWAFNIAYNAMHQAGRAYMFHAGYRSVGEGHHGTVVLFLEIALGAEYGDTLAVMDRMRRKRNRATYDRVGTISRKEADEAVSVAREFVAVVAKQVGRRSGKR